MKNRNTKNRLFFIHF